MINSVDSKDGKSNTEVNLTDVKTLKYQVLCQHPDAQDFKNKWSNYLKISKEQNDKSKWCLISMKWFKKFKNKYSIANLAKDVNSNNFKHEVPTNIDNSDLISQEFIIFRNSTENNKQKSYTGKLLKEDLKLNVDYTIVGYYMFDHILKNLGYKCNNTIWRLGYKDSLTEKITIEVNLQKVRVLTVPDWIECNDFDVIQFSKYDTVNDLYSRFQDTDKYESVKLWKVNCFEESIHNVIKKYKDFYKDGGEFNYKINEILQNDD